MLHQGLPFRGHNETKESNNKENFKELINYTDNHNEVIGNVALKNSPRNNQMASNNSEGHSLSFLRVNPLEETGQCILQRRLQSYTRRESIYSC